MDCWQCYVGEMCKWFTSLDGYSWKQHIWYERYLTVHVYVLVALKQHKHDHLRVNNLLVNTLLTNDLYELSPEKCYCCTDTTVYQEFTILPLGRTKQNSQCYNMCSYVTLVIICSSFLFWKRIDIPFVRIRSLWLIQSSNSMLTIALLYTTNVIWKS